MFPLETGAKETLDFLLVHLPRRAVRLLEVGCGRGHLTRMIADHGVNVRGLDISEEAIEETRSRGLDAVCSDFLQFEDAPYDVVFFSRSLHHIHPVAKALERADALLKADGLLIVEDFGVELADARSAAWLYGAESLLQKAGLLICETDECRADDDHLARWKTYHSRHHSLADSTTMREKLRERFAAKPEERAPYLYRYLLDSIEPAERGLAAARHLIDWERSLIAASALPAIGVRWVAVKSITLLMTR
ncbi:MAG: class I SAM-dependent methyltransferase [Acidobacteriota bacterium]